MNQRYWVEFYKQFEINKHSSFAEFALEFMPKKPVYLLDMGCGTGRDSYFFTRQGIRVQGIYEPD